MPTPAIYRPFSRPHGFTLIEVMVTVAIIAILAAIAYPAYSDYVLRGRLVDGTNALAATRAQMEQYFQDNRTYAAITGVTHPCNGGQTLRNFTISCPAKDVSASTYIITATGTGALQGFSYTINETGATTSTVPTDWGTSPCNGTSFVMKKGDSC